jgi:hypothetical protein
MAQDKVNGGSPEHCNKCLNSIKGGGFLGSQKAEASCEVNFSQLLQIFLNLLAAEPEYPSYLIYGFCSTNLHAFRHLNSIVFNLKKIFLKYALRLLVLKSRGSHQMAKC